MWRIYKYIQHLFYRTHRKGHGIHSPYLFELVNQVLFNGAEVEIPEAVSSVRKALSKDRNSIPPLADWHPRGAGSKVAGGSNRSVRSFVNGSSVKRRQGAVLFRMARWQNPDMILELGTGLGLSTLYLAFGLRDASGQETAVSPVLTVEGDAARADFSRQLFKRMGLDEVKVCEGDLDEQIEELAGKLPGRYLAFVDANHQYAPTLRYLRLLTDAGSDEAIIVLDDIYWSKGMYRAWKEVISWPEIRISIDLFHMGVLLLRKDLNKTHLKIKI